MEEKINIFKTSIIRISNSLNKYFRKNFIFIIPIALIVFLLCGYAVGYSRSTKEYFFKNLTRAIDNEDLNKLSKLISFEGDKEELEPFLKYLKIDSNKENFISSLKSTEIYDDFTLITNKNFIFKSYVIKANTIDISVKVNYPSEIYIDGSKVGDSKLDEPLKVTKPISGLYNLEARVINEYGDVTSSEEVPIFENTEVSLNIEGNPVTINSPYEDGDVFINDGDIHKKVKEIKNFSFFSSDEQNKIYFNYDFPWGTIKSEEVSIGKYPEVSPKINLVNNKLRSDINGVTKNFYNSVFEALNKQDMNLIKSVPEDLSFSIYSDLTQKYFLLKNNYSLEEINVKPEEDSFKYEGDNKYSGRVLTNLKYSTSKKIIGFTLEGTSEEKSFITTCEYDNGVWKIISLNKN